MNMRLTFYECEKRVLTKITFDCLMVSAEQLNVAKMELPPVKPLP